MLKPAPPGTTHRDLDKEQHRLHISVQSKGELVKTADKTRELTTSWRNNLLMQKKPNADGIQCHDPRLNKHVVVVKAPEYNQHIHITGSKKPVESLDTLHSTENLRRELLGGAQGKSSYSRRANAINDELQASATSAPLTPPPNAPAPPTPTGRLFSEGLDLSSSSQPWRVADPETDEVMGSEQSIRKGRKGEDGEEKELVAALSLCGQQVSRPSSSAVRVKASSPSPLTLDPGFPLLQASPVHAVHAPVPLSPSAMAQKLRRYRIGSSPQQKVRNMLDDLQNVMISSAKGRSRGSPKGSPSAEVGEDAGQRKGRMQHGVLRTVHDLPGVGGMQGGADSFWEERSDGADARHQANHIVGGQLKKYLEQASPTDNKQETDENHMIAGNLMDSKVAAQLSQGDYMYLMKQTQQMPTNQDDPILMEGQAELDVNKPFMSNTRSMSSSFGDEVSIDQMVRTSITEQPLSLTPRMNRMHGSVVLQPDYAVVDDESIPSLASFDTHQHNSYLAEYDIAKKRGFPGHRLVGPGSGNMLQQKQSHWNEENVRHHAEQIHREQQPWKKYKDKRIDANNGSEPLKSAKTSMRRLGSRSGTGYVKSGNYNYQTGEEDSRGAFSEQQLPAILHPQHPPCHLCRHEGRLWCDGCKVVYCYNCWGTIEHHDPRDATAKLHEDVQLTKRLLKYGFDPGPSATTAATGTSPEATSPKKAALTTSPVNQMGTFHKFMNPEVSASLGHMEVDVRFASLASGMATQSLSISLSPGSSVEGGAKSPFLSSSAILNGSPAADLAYASIAEGSESVYLSAQQERGLEQGSAMQSLAMTDRLEGTSVEWDGQADTEERAAKSTTRHSAYKGVRIAQFSRTNSEKHYYQQVVTPYVPPGSDPQTRLWDTYVEYDEVNATHFSPEKKNPAAVRATKQRMAQQLAITSERMRGYGADLENRNQRMNQGARVAATQLTQQVQQKYPNRLREQGKRQTARLEAARLDGRPDPKPVDGLGKLVFEVNTAHSDGTQASLRLDGVKAIPGVHLAASLSMQLDSSTHSWHAMKAPSQQSLPDIINAPPILRFEESPLNRTLDVPVINADGSLSRQPPNPILLGLAANEQRRIQEMQTEEKHKARVLSEQERQNNNMRQYRLELMKKQEEKASQLQSLSRSRSRSRSPPRRSGASSAELPTTAVDTPDERHPTSAALTEEAPHSTAVQQQDEGLQTVAASWGFHPMRAKSADTGNFPQLPFRGPPYVVDLKEEVHYSTVIRPFSPQKPTVGNMGSSGTTSSVNPQESNSAVFSAHVSKTSSTVFFAPSQGQISTQLSRAGASTLWGKFKKTQDSAFDEEGLI